MPTVAEIVSKAARACSIKPPASWINSASLNASDFRDFLSDTVDEILDRLDLPSPVSKDVTITGTGVETYALPADFKRLTRDPYAVYETTTTRRIVSPVKTNGEWSHLKQIGSAGGGRFYRLGGDETEGFTMDFYRPLEAGHSVTVSYVSANWVRGVTANRAQWLAMEDLLILPPRLVELGMIWRFRKRKRMAYADDLAEYELRMARAINDSRGIKSVDMSGSGAPRHPMRVPVPDFIPVA
jgi:hypothetical protein